MKIFRLQYNNFMGYKFVQLPGVKENFPNGLILISGPNSHGKSTIVEGILYAFFGSRAFPGKKAEDFINYGEHEAEIYLYFELDDEKYYLHRKWNRSNKKSKKLFKYPDSTSFVSQHRDSILYTDRNASYRLFRILLPVLHAKITVRPAITPVRQQ